MGPARTKSNMDTSRNQIELTPNLECRFDQAEDLRGMLQPLDQLQMIETGIVAQRRDENADAIHRQDGGQHGQHRDRARAEGAPEQPAVEGEADDPDRRSRDDEIGPQRQEEICDEADRRNQEQAQ